MRILVVGVGGPVGKSIVKSLLNENHNVIAASRSADNLDEHENLISKSVDFGNMNQVDSFIKECENYEIDIVIWNTASGMQQSTVNDLPTDWNSWIYSFGVSVISQASVVRSIGNGMISRKNGQIINITSKIGHTPNSDSYAYGATKSAMSYLIKLFNSNSPYIRATEIVPGNIRYANNEYSNNAIEVSDVVDAVMYLINTPKYLNIPRIDLMHTENRK